MSARNPKTVKELVLQGNYGYGWDDLTYYEDTPEGRAERKADYQTYKENEPGVAFRTIERRVPNKNYVAPDVDSSCTKKSVKASVGDSIELTFICPDLETGRLVADKAQEIGGFGSTWNETKWVYIDVPTSQSVDNVDDLIQYAQSVGVFLNRPSAKLLDAWADSKSDLVLRGSTELSIKSNKINKRRAITAAEGLNDMKIIVKSKAFVDITVDDYEQGALDMVNSWDFDVRGEYDTIQELIDRIANESYIFSDNIADYYYMDGRIGTSAMVDADNSVPTEDQYEAWKRGEETLYIADLYLPLEVGGGSHEMTEEEAEAFGLALY